MVRFYTGIRRLYVCECESTESLWAPMKSNKEIEAIIEWKFLTGPSQLDIETCRVRMFSNT